MAFNHPVTMRRTISIGGLLLLAMLLPVFTTADSDGRGSPPFLLGLGFLLTSVFGPQAALAGNESPAHEKLERPGGIYERTVKTGADGIKVVLREDITFTVDGLEGRLQREHTRIRTRSSNAAERIPIDREGKFIHQIDRASVFIGLGMLSVGLALLGIGYHFGRFEGGWFICKMFGPFIAIAGLVFVLIAGYGSRTTISRTAGMVRQERSWYGLYWKDEYRLDRFDRILVDRNVTRSRTGTINDRSYTTNVSYNVRLSGKESLLMGTFEWAFDALDFGRRLSNDSGLPVTEQL